MKSNVCEVSVDLKEISVHDDTELIEFATEKLCVGCELKEFGGDGDCNTPLDQFNFNKTINTVGCKYKIAYTILVDTGLDKEAAYLKAID